MRIDPTIGQAVRGVDDAGKTASSRPKAAAPQDSQGLEIGLSQQRLVDAARQAPEVRADAVAEAKRLLKTGQLDTPEAAVRAAAAIVERGV